MLSRTRDRCGKGEEDSDRGQTEDDNGKQNLYEGVAGLRSARPFLKA
jgi:hypothetical protein